MDSKKVVSMNSDKIVFAGLIIITLFVSGCIDSFLSESDTQSTGTEKAQAMSTTVMFTPSTSQAQKTVPNDSTQPDLSKIEIHPIEDNNTKLLDYYFNYTILEEKDICVIFRSRDEAMPGDPGIIIRGTLKNEYDRDYYIFLRAEAYDSNGNLLGSCLDSGPICGLIAPHVKSNKTENFELHLKYYSTISRINLISGGVSEIAPP